MSHQWPGNLISKGRELVLLKTFKSVSDPFLIESKYSHNKRTEKKKLRTDKKELRTAWCEGRR